MNIEKEELINYVVEGLVYDYILEWYKDGGDIEVLRKRVNDKIEIVGNVKNKWVEYLNDKYKFLKEDYLIYEIDNNIEVLNEIIENEL